MYALISKIETKQDFEQFLSAFLEFCRDKNSEIENQKIDDYIWAMLNYCDIIERKKTSGAEPDLDHKVSWRTVAELLFASAIME